jgi:hypothetical protein
VCICVCVCVCICVCVCVCVYAGSCSLNMVHKGVCLNLALKQFISNIVFFSYGANMRLCAPLLADSAISQS